MRKSPFLYIIVLIAFLANTFGLLPLAQAQEFRLPAPGIMVHLSPEFNPPILKGIKVHPDNPFRFDFILDQGDSSVIPAKAGIQNQEQLKIEATKLIKYFLASLTIPEKDLWVNLSPYEKERIIPQSFGLTEMGRDLLAEDYMLKQITASLIYPEGETGKKFWKRIYKEAAKKFGTTNIPVNTFNKVWIVPEKAVVYENAKAGTAYVVEAKLKVMLEQDYLALSHTVIPASSSVIPAKAGIQDTGALGSQIIREIVIPELTKEVNENKNFAQLRQVYNSLILATWYKKKIKDSILAQVYADKNKTVGVQYISTVIPAKAGIQINDVEAIYQRYLQAFKKGVYNYIKEDTDPVTQDTIPRKYFSGGVDFAMTNNSTTMNGINGVMDVTDAPSALQRILNFIDPRSLFDVQGSFESSGGPLTPSPKDQAMRVMDLAHPSLDGHPFFDFVVWMDQVADATTRILSEDELNSLAGQLNVTGQDLKAKAVSVAQASYDFYKQLPKDGKINVYLFRDAFGLYMAERTAGRKPLAMPISKALVQKASGASIDLVVLGIINESKSRLDLDLNLPIPEGRFGEFKTKFFQLFDALINGKDIGQVNAANKLILERRNNLRLITDYLSAYAVKTGITADLIRNKGVRFIDTTMRGTFVLLMEAVAREMMKKAAVADTDMEGKTDSRMFYSSLSQAMGFMDINDQGRARAVELNGYPVELKGVVKFTAEEPFQEPLIQSISSETNKFLFFVAALKSELLKGTGDQAMATWSRKKVFAAIVAGTIAAVGAWHVGTSVIKNNQAVSSEIQARVVPKFNISTEELKTKIDQVQKDLSSKNLQFWRDLFSDYPQAPVSIVVTQGVIERASQVGQLDNLFNALRLQPKLLNQYLSEIPEDQMTEFSRYFASLRPGTRQQIFTIFYQRMWEDFSTLEKTRSWDLLPTIFSSAYNELANQAIHERLLYGVMMTALNGFSASPSIVAVTREQSTYGIYKAVVNAIASYRQKGNKVIFMPPNDVNVSNIAKLMKNGQLEQLGSLPSYLQSNQIENLSQWVQKTTDPSNPKAHRITQEELLTKAMELHFDPNTNSVDLFGAIVTIIEYLGIEGKKDNYIWDKFDHGWLMGLLDPGNGRADDQGRPVRSWLNVDNNGFATIPRGQKTGIGRYSSTYNDFYLSWGALLTSFYVTVKTQDEIKKDFETVQRNEPNATLPGTFEPYETFSRIFRNKLFSSNGTIALPMLYKEFQDGWKTRGVMGIEEHSFWKYVILRDKREGTQGESWGVFAVVGRMLAEKMNTTGILGLEFAPKKVSDRSMTTQSAKNADINPIPAKAQLTAEDLYKEIIRHPGEVINNYNSQYYVTRYKNLGVVVKVPKSSGLEPSVTLAQERLGGKVVDFITVHIEGKQIIIQKNVEILSDVLDREIKRMKGQSGIALEETKKSIKSLLEKYFKLQDEMIRRGVFDADPKLFNYGVVGNDVLPADIGDLWDISKEGLNVGVLMANLQLLKAKKQFPEISSIFGELAQEHHFSDVGSITNKLKSIDKNALEPAVPVDGDPLIEALSKNLKIDNAMGGIDLTPANMNLQTKMDSREIQFHLNPAMLAQLQNAPGFVPVIISVKPLGDLQGFLGIVNQIQ